jgi:hypothetical protein
VNSAADSLGWIGSLLGLAFFTTVVTGGTVRGVSPVPGDSFFRSLSRATWWVSPVLVASAAAWTAWALRATPAAAAVMVGTAAIGLALCWSWRPSRADDLWLPTWLMHLRVAARVQIRDAAAWRRQLVDLGVSVIVVAAAVWLVPRG